MNKSELIDGLKNFVGRLSEDVFVAFQRYGREFGRERFSAWRRQLTKFLDENLPGSSTRLDAKLYRAIFVSGGFRETDFDVFYREYGESALAFLESLILDIQNDEYDEPVAPLTNTALEERKTMSNKKVFIVHGHDELIKIKVARFIDKIGLQAIILHEQANQGMTIIEKIEACTDVGFAIVLYTPDDKGNSNSKADKGELNSRARQNVVFEHGYLIAKLSRKKVVPLVAEQIELPSDISGVVYISDKNWELDIAKEMRVAGYDIDLNKLADA